MSEPKKSKYLATFKGGDYDGKSIPVAEGHDLLLHIEEVRGRNGELIHAIRNEYKRVSIGPHFKYELSH